MRILIATSIYPPEVGGPSYYAVGLASALQAESHAVEIVTFGSIRHFPTGIRHSLFFFRILPKIWRADVVIALDTFSAGVPVALACAMLRKPLIIRTGGDFLWEQYIERTHDLVPLPQFYPRHPKLRVKERIIFALTRFAVRRASMVFSTKMQRDIWLPVYGISKEKAHVIENAVDVPLPSEEPSKKNFLWYVRPIAMKNGERVRAAFAKAKEKYPEIILEEGMIPKNELLKRMKSCYAVILPSITEISPNYILDALRFKKPFIMDKYSGLAEWLAPYGMLVDPLDEDDIVRAIEKLSTQSGYEEAKRKAASFSLVRTYDDVASDFLKLI